MKIILDALTAYVPDNSADNQGVVEKCERLLRGIVNELTADDKHRFFRFFEAYYEDNSILVVSDDAVTSFLNKIIVYDTESCIKHAKKELDRLALVLLGQDEYSA